MSEKSKCKHCYHIIHTAEWGTYVSMNCHIRLCNLFCKTVCCLCSGEEDKDD